MGEPPIPSLELKAARRSLEGISGCRVLGGWCWYPRLNRWVLRCQLTISCPSLYVPETTEWHVSVSPSHPWGSLKLFPSQKGGLTATFPHQSHNGSGPDDLPWRMGDLCLFTGLRALGRHGFDTEPFESTRRLRWHILRALDWLRAAANGSLVRPGDPFELPHFPDVSQSHQLLTFEEGSASLANWQSIPNQCGLAEMTLMRQERDILAVSEFRSVKGESLWRPSWLLNSHFKSRPEDSGVWIRLKESPVLEPWHAPATWGELRTACVRQGIHLDEPLRQLLGLIRDGRPRLLLLGFPIPDIVDGPTNQMHWQGITLPAVSHGKQTMRGFRPQKEGQWLRDRRELLRNSAKVIWVESENWTRERLIARGQLGSPLVSSDVLLIGGGALGSAVAELLVRAGIRRLLIMDGDDVEAGNLCRHTLLMSDIRQNKARALARRLKQVSPHVDVEAVESSFPPTTAVHREKLQGCEVVIDCTADDSVLRELGRFPWESTSRFASLSLGFGAKRLFCFVAAGTRFPSGAYRKTIQPWLEREQREAGGVELVREGAGCWHPVFPARADDIWLLAAASVKYLDHIFRSPILRTTLTVFEQEAEEGFSGLTRTVEEL